MIKILFMGRKTVAARCLSKLIEHDNVEVVGVLTDNHLEVSPTTDVALKHRLPLFRFEEALEACEKGELAFDLGLSMLYWRKLSGALLTKPNLGIVNFHPAPLPDYKGVGGYNLAILDALNEWACTAHYVDESIDTGEIISVRRFAIDKDEETARSLEAKSRNVLFELFSDVFEQLIEKQSILPTKPNKGGRYLNRKELEELKRVDLDRDDLDRKTRAFWFPPYDGAFIEVGGKRYTLIDRTILDDLADPTASCLFTPRAKK